MSELVACTFKDCTQYHHNDRGDGRCDLHRPEPEAPKKTEQET